MDFLDSVEGVLIFAAIGLFVGALILYTVIKMAIKDAYKEMKQTTYIAPTPTAPVWNEAQRALQSKYEKGELTLEQYNEEWKKIS